MVSEETVKFLVLLVSWSPLLLLMIADARTRVYRRWRHNSDCGSSSSLKLPLLVRLHERTLAGYWTFLIYMITAVPIFLIPLYLYGIFWPEEVPELLGSMVFNVPIFLAAACCYVCNLPAFPESKAEHPADEETVPIDSEGL